MRSVAMTLLLKLALDVGLVELLIPTVGRARPLPAAALGLAVAAVTYVAVDRGLLARAGNALAVVLDFALAVAILWSLARWLPGVRLTFGASLPIAGALSIAEILYHQYLLRQGVGVP